MDVALQVVLFEVALEVVVVAYTMHGTFMKTRLDTNIVHTASRECRFEPCLSHDKEVPLASWLALPQLGIENPQLAQAHDPVPLSFDMLPQDNHEACGTSGGTHEIARLQVMLANS